MSDPKIYYRVVEADPTDHQITVRFYSEKLPETELVSVYKADGVTPARYRTDYAITLPIPAPTGDDLHALIMRSCPLDWFAIVHAARDPDVDTSLPHIAVGMVREVAPLPVPEPSDTEVVAGYMAQVQQHMDATARTYGYDNLISVISYADEPAVPRYQTEGQAFRAWRSVCWFACEQMLAAVKAGERPAPTHAELIAELPELSL